MGKKNEKLQRDVGGGGRLHQNQIDHASEAGNYLVVFEIEAKRMLGTHEMVAIVADANNFEVVEVGVNGNNVEAIVGACALDALSIAPMMPIGGAGYGNVEHAGIGQAEQIVVMMTRQMADVNAAKLLESDDLLLDFKGRLAAVESLVIVCRMKADAEAIMDVRGCLMRRRDDEDPLLTRVKKLIRKPLKLLGLMVIIVQNEQTDV